ncbi:allantoate amidohydrolase [Actinocatenispora rupis]|uniref:Zn-dependent hydrolase n=1 Tax=Actinocatenispora rupis TaxID=519421 RepID=A0A8J3J738_9ACTN|nr:allantoate amidohydrolase [Actinocatenispora rupis]GID10603.1 Zn-dependent hydrolase [Actinocatenispora rupis]
MSTVDGRDRFRTLWEELLPIGRASGGGYARHGFSDADQACREWFTAQATARGMTVDPDGNGNLWAWWGDPAAGNALVTGSHLDSVPNGGAYDGPLGVVSAFLAVDLLREQGFQPSRPIGVVAFCEEEGSRFGVACLGSRLLTGALDAERGAELTDPTGTTLVDAMAAAGADPSGLGADPVRLSRIGHYVELHIEQGRGLAELDAAVGVGTAIWPHGRWRFDFTGEANHAGTTLMADRHDPMLSYAMTALAANKQARLHEARATFGRIQVEPNGTNAIPSRVTAWLDARAAEQSTLDAMLADLERQARDRVDRDGTGLTVTAESVSGVVEFDRALAGRLARGIGTGKPVPALPTGAGHDAGILATAGIPTAMLFVRNPTGVSHSPAETTADDDCVAGVTALADALRELS